MSKLNKIKIGDHLKLITDYHSNGSYEILKKHVELLKKENYAVIIRTLNFERNDFKDELLFVTKEAYDFLEKSYVLPDDILMNKISNAGSIYIMPNINKPVTCGMNLFLLRFDDTVNQRYMYYNMKNIENYIKSFAHGTTTTTITKDEVKNIDIFIHDKKEQDKIERILTMLDSKIELNNKINAELEAMAKTLYDYWFLQFEFPNEEGKPYKSSGGKMVWNEELKREIPEGWKVDILENIIVENKKSKVQTREIDNIGNVPFFTSGESILLTNSKLVDGFNCYLSTGGNANVKFFDGEASYSTDTWSITSTENLKYLLAFYLKSIENYMDIKFFAGTGLKHLQKTLLKEEQIVIPDNNTLTNFNHNVQKYMVLISKNKRENYELSKLRDFLLPLLMNGQVGFKE